MMVADRGLRFAIVLLVLVATLAAWQPHASVATPEQVTTELTLYAHTDSSIMQMEGRILTLSGNSTSRHYADVRDGLAFVLLPPLSAPLHILGTINVDIWLESQQTLRGTVQVTISEVTENASVKEIRSSSVTLRLPPNPYLIEFGLGGVNYTLATGSTLEFEARVSPVISVPVMLLWDDPATPTRLVMRVEALPKIALMVTDTAGRTSNIFPGNETSETELLVKVTVEDPFHGTNVKTVLLTVTNSTGFSLFNDVPMNLTSHAESPFHLDYAFPIAIPFGQFNVTVSVRDAANRNFIASREITVAGFYTLILLLVDAQERAVSGLNISVLAFGQPIVKAATNSTGWTSIRVPSSDAVGPLTLQVRDHGLVILSRSIEAKSDSAIRLETPLYDWAIFVKLQGLDTPIAGARVDLDLNETLVVSAMTDANGAARFTAVPLGEYKVTVTSPLAFKRYVNVTHSPESKETALELPILAVVSSTTALLLARNSYRGGCRGLRCRAAQEKTFQRRRGTAR